MSDTWRQNYRRIRRRRNTTYQDGGGIRPLLSLAIPTIVGREHHASYLTGKLNEQITACGKPIELIVLYDNRYATTGAKRNLMVGMASGEYIAHLDDDDDVTDDYVAELTSAIESHRGVDVITFDYQRQSPSLNFRRTFRVGTKRTRRKMVPIHLMAWRFDIARQYLFADVCLGDDVDWTAAINSRPRSEHHIDKVLYRYRVGFGGNWAVHGHGQ